MTKVEVTVNIDGVGVTRTFVYEDSPDELPANIVQQLTWSLKLIKEYGKPERTERVSKLHIAQE